MIHTLEKMMTEQGDKLSASDREPLDQAIKKVRESISTGDVAAIKAATSELEQAAQAFRSTLGAKPAGGAEAASVPRRPETMTRSMQNSKSRINRLD